jgi:hypothetical protein
MSTLTNEEVLALLPEFKMRLGIEPSDTSKDEKLKMDIRDAYEHCVAWCRFDFRKEEGVLELTGSVKKGMALMIQIDEAMKGREGIASESIGGMSQSFTDGSNDNTRYGGVYALWRAYRRIEFIPVTTPYAGYVR